MVSANKVSGPCLRSLEPLRNPQRAMLNVTQGTLHLSAPSELVARRCDPPGALAGRGPFSFLADSTRRFLPKRWHIILACDILLATTALPVYHILPTSVVFWLCTGTNFTNISRRSTHLLPRHTPRATVPTV